MSSVIQFRARDPSDSTTDTDLYDIKPVRRSFNRFDSGAVALFEDTDGTKINSYSYGQRVEIQVSKDGGSSWTTLLPGLTLTPNRTNRDGNPSVEIELQGYSHLLTRESIVKDYSSTSKTNILKDVIESFTPVRWVAANVTIEDDSSIDLSVRGETPDEVIARVVSKSANEEFFVNGDLEFVAQQQDAERADAITDDDVIDHNLPEEGKRAINKFTVYYGSNLSNAWTEEDREAQNELKNQLNSPRRVVIGDSDGFPEVSTEAEAKDIAKRRLDNQSQIQTGEITIPLGRFDTEPGDVFALTINDAGIQDADFRVAQIDYEWTKGRATLTIAENTGGDVEELLISLSDSLSNARMRDADPNATETLALTMQSGITASLTTALTTKTRESGAFVFGQSELGDGTDDTIGGGVASRSSVTVNTKRVTASLLNMIRDLWINGNSSFTDLTHLAAGTGSTDASRADDSLESEVGRVELAKFGVGNSAQKFEFVASIPAGGLFGDAGDLQELSIADAASGGNHYARLTHDAVTIDGNTRLKIHLVAEIDDDDDEQGVITTKGQERLRDLVIGESGHEPTDLLYGTGTADPAESDTSLGSKQHEDTIDSTETGQTGEAQLVERTQDAEADTTNWSETGAENSSDELLQRVVFEAYDSDVVLETILGFKAANP